MDRDRAKRSSKGKKEDPQDYGVGSKRVRQQAKLAKTSRPGPSPPSPLKGFKMLPACDINDLDEIEDYPEQNVQATYSLHPFNQSSNDRLFRWRLRPSR